MKKNLTKSIILIFLAITFIISGTACTEHIDSSESSKDTTVVSDAGTEAVSVDTNGYVLDSLPELNFEKQSVTFLTWSDVEHEEFSVEKLTGNNINDAIWERNIAVENTLNVELNFYGIPGNADHISDYVNYVANAISAGTNDFDIIAAHSQSIANCVQGGYCMNLLDYDYLDFTMPWWPERLITEATINNKLYFCSGDISANTLYMMYVCFFNKQIIDQYDLSNPYDLVESNEWTYEKFMDMCDGIYSDLNNNNVKDVGDQFGYMVYNLHADPWFYGADCVILDKDSEGDLKVSDTRSCDKVIKTLEMVNGLLWNTNDGMYTTSTNQENCFTSGYSLFMTDRSRVAFTNLTQTDFEYGVVPMPKYDSEQGNYVTVLGNPFTSYAIPQICENPEMCAAILECYASESYRQLTPEIFEITMKAKYAKDSTAGQMYDIARETVTFDIGRIFSNVLIPQNKFRKMISENTNDWASTVATTTDLLNEKLEILMKTFEE